MTAEDSRDIDRQILDILKREADADRVALAKGEIQDAIQRELETHTERCIQTHGI